MQGELRNIIAEGAVASTSAHPEPVEGHARLLIYSANFPVAFDKLRLSGPCIRNIHSAVHPPSME